LLGLLESSNITIIGKNRIIGAKVSNQEGNSPDCSLRSIKIFILNDFYLFYPKEVGLEAAIH